MALKGYLTLTRHVASLRVLCSKGGRDGPCRKALVGWYICRPTSGHSRYHRQTFWQRSTIGRGIRICAAHLLRPEYEGNLPCGVAERLEDISRRRDFVHNQLESLSTFLAKSLRVPRLSRLRESSGGAEISVEIHCHHSVNRKQSAKPCDMWYDWTTNRWACRCVFFQRAASTILPRFIRPGLFPVLPFCRVSGQRE